MDRTANIEIRSQFDGSTQLAALRLPAKQPTEPIPLIYAPHPFGWTVDEDYFGGCPDLRAGDHDGWRGVASELAVAILQPTGHARRVDGCSLGYEATIRDVPELIASVRECAPVDSRRIYACGLSMGGQEALLAAGTYPGVFAATFAFNPVVDVAAWWRDLTRTADGDLRAERNDALISEEVGGTPEEVPELYRQRSPLRLMEGLSRVPLSIWWSTHDLVVPHQVEHHGKRLYDLIKSMGAANPVTEYDQSLMAGIGPNPTDRDRWAVHETADYAFAARWLLLHRNSGLPPHQQKGG